MSRRIWILIIWALTFQHIVAQEVIRSNTITEDFENNKRGWLLANGVDFQTSIENNIYSIALNPSSSWHHEFTLPEPVGKCLIPEESDLTFDLSIRNDNNAGSAGIGLIFDRDGENYNLLYIGEESGRLFSSIIPRRGKFLTPMKDGGAINFAFENKYHVQLKRKATEYQVLLNKKIILTFIHQNPIEFSQLYCTTGKYEISTFHAFRSDFFIDEEGLTKSAKAFDPSSHKIYVMLVGIRNYEQGFPPALNSPVNDIVAMKGFWKSAPGGGIPESRISFLKNELATRKNIQDEALKLALEATGNDVIILYLSGHGIPGNYCAYDQAYVSYAALSKILNISRAKNKLLIVDACFSGSIKNYVAPPSKGNISPAELNLLFYYGIAAAARNTNYLLSCDETEISLDGTSTSNSVFTTALLSVLRSKGSKQSGEILTLGDVYNSLTAYFQDWNRKHFGQTTSVILKDSDFGNRTIEFKMAMSPQLISGDKNNLNLPLVIMP